MFQNTFSTGLICKYTPVCVWGDQHLYTTNAYTVHPFPVFRSVDDHFRPLLRSVSRQHLNYLVTTHKGSLIRVYYLVIRWHPRLTHPPSGALPPMWDGPTGTPYISHIFIYLSLEMFYNGNAQNVRYKSKSTNNGSIKNQLELRSRTFFCFRLKNLTFKKLNIIKLIIFNICV